MEPRILVLIALGVLAALSAIPAVIRARARHLIARSDLVQATLDRPIDQYTRLLLDENGLTAVEVEVKGRIASLFVGDTYHVRRRVIRLSHRTAHRASKVDLALACRLVALAKDAEAGGADARLAVVNRYLRRLPLLLLPLAIAGVIADLAKGGTIGDGFLLLTGIGFGLTLAAWCFATITYGANKRTLADGLYLILASGLLTAEEEKLVKRLFAEWRRLYSFDALLTVFALLWFLLRLMRDAFTTIAPKKN